MIPNHIGTSWQALLGRLYRRCCLYKDTIRRIYIHLCSLSITINLVNTCSGIIDLIAIINDTSVLQIRK